MSVHCLCKSTHLVFCVHFVQQRIQAGRQELLVKHDIPFINTRTRLTCSGHGLLSGKHTIITDYKLYIAHAEEGQLGKHASFLWKYFCRNSKMFRKGKKMHQPISHINAVCKPTIFLFSLLFKSYCNVFW